MNLNKDQILSTLNKVEKFRKLKEELDDETREVNKYCTSYARDLLKGFPVRVFELCSWLGQEAVLKVSTIWQPAMAQSDPPCTGFFHYMGDGRFAWSKSDTYKLYQFQVFEAPPRFDTEKLLDICKQISQDLGIKCEVIKTEILEACQGSPRNNFDVLALHPEGKIIGSGKIEYRGWYCTDNWVVVEDSRGKHLYYGTSADGSGMNEHIAPGEDLTDFLDLYEDDSVFFSVNPTLLLDLD